jgi:putative hydrolase of the HAD superfamily
MGPNQFAAFGRLAMIQTVVFDLDDTLYDEVDYCLSGFARVAPDIAALSNRHNPETVLAMLRKRFLAGDREKLFNVTLETLGVPYDGAVIERLVAAYRKHRPAIALPPDVRATLDQLKNHYTLALLTDGYLPAQKLKVEALGVAGYFHSIVYTEELGRAFWKPSPRGFERLMDLTNTPAERMAYVGDNETKDFIAPNALGMLTVQVLRPARLHTDRSPLPHARAAHLIGRLGDLPGLLEQAG